MTPSSPRGAVTLTDHERERAERVDRLVAEGARGVPGLISMLDDPSWTVRRGVVSGLAALGDAAVDALCRTLEEHRDDEGRIAAAVDALSTSIGRADDRVERMAHHANPAVVADAAQILGRRRSASAVPLLVTLIDHASDNVAVAAIEALGRIGGRAAVESLIQAVRSGNFFRVFPAIDVLGRSGDPRAVEPLAGLLQQSSYAFEAARALGRTGERRAVTPLAKLLGSGSDAAVRVAAVALSDLQERFAERAGAASTLDAQLRRDAAPNATRHLGTALAGADISESAAICRLLGVLGGDNAMELLARRLDAPPLVARAAADAIKRLGGEADTQLLAALRDGDSARRRAVLPIIGRSAALHEVLRCLGDGDAEVRALACDTLARLGNPSVVERLFRLLEDPSPRVVQAASAAIQSLGSARARELATDAASSPIAQVRRSAVRILAYFGDAASLPVLLQALRDPDLRVREAALQGLPLIDDRRALEAVLEAARGPDAKTRAAAMRSLGHGGSDPRIAATLLSGLDDPDAWARYYACQSLGRLAHAPAAAKLAARLSDEAVQVRVAAVEALSHLADEDAHTALREAAASGELDVRRSALIGIGIAGHADDLPLLLDAAEQGDLATRLVALSALSGFDSPAVVAALGRAAADPDEQLSTAAIGFLAAKGQPEATELLVGLLGRPEARDRAMAALVLPSGSRIGGLLAALETAGEELAPLLTSILAKQHRGDATAALFQALRLPNVAARKAAAGTLAVLGTAEATGALREAAEHDPDPQVRHICALLLAE